MLENFMKKILLYFIFDKLNNVYIYIIQYNLQ